MGHPRLDADGSTVHFGWSGFTDRVSGTFDGGKVSAATARENAELGRAWWWQSGTI